MDDDERLYLAHPLREVSTPPEPRPREEPITVDADDLGIVGRTAAIVALRSQIRRVAQSRAPVLVLGESGTGKELVARAIHACGRSAAPFVAVNAATLRGPLFQSECFGHERGAFTGALARRKGLFEQASGGSLFIDEAGELDSASQAELLRVIESGEIRPLGAEHVRKVRTRIVAATHRSLETMVLTGSFRADLFFRLRAFVLCVPALRQRTEDIPLIAEHLLERLSPEIGTRALTREALHRLEDHPWPGNVRELLHVLQRAAVFTDRTVLDDADIANALTPDPTLTAPPPAVLLPSSDDAIRTALQLAKGSMKGAAKILGIPRSTLRDRLAKSRRKPD